MYRKDRYFTAGLFLNTIRRTGKAKNNVLKMTVAYCRCSTDEQVRDGVSLAAQEQRIRAFATATGREVDEIIVDQGLSARSLARPELKRLLAAVQNGTVGTVIVLKLDRLTRSVKDLSHILELFAKAGADLISVSESLDTSSAAGRMGVNLLGVFAQFERELIGERTSLALAFKRQSGNVYGPIPFGYCRDGNQLIPHPDEYPVLLQARQLRRDGASLRVIARWLSERGLKPKRGGKEWHAATVRSILSSRMAEDAVLA